MSLGLTLLFDLRGIISRLLNVVFIVFAALVITVIIAICILFLLFLICVEVIDKLLLSALSEGMERYLFYYIVYYRKGRNADEKSYESPETSEEDYRKHYGEGGELDVASNDMRIDDISVDKLNG